MFENVPSTSSDIEVLGETPFFPSPYEAPKLNPRLENGNSHTD